MLHKRVVLNLLLGLLVSVGVAACGGGGGKPRNGGSAATVPAAPTQLVATPGDARVTLSWTASSGATSYNVYEGRASGAQGATPVQTGIVGTTATISGLNNGGAYYYTVRAVNSAGVSPPSNEVAATPVAPGPTTAIEITKLELAQTHVLPETGLSWTLANASENLHLVGQRDAFALVVLSKGDASNPRIEGWLAGTQLGSVALAPPAELPRTEAGAAAYAGDRYSATLPAAWLKQGLQLRVSASNYLASAFRTPVIGADSPMTLRILPFYLFGANESTRPLSQIAVPPTAVIDEVFAKWPVASLQVLNHPAQRAIWPVLSNPPRYGLPAYVIHNSSEQKDGFDGMSTMHGIARGLLSANGEGEAAVHYYVPLVMLNSAGVSVGTGGGIGGGRVGVGDTGYGGIFIHEQGHAFGLPHQGGAYAEGRYPYAGGSLNGSAWGFDAIRRELLSTLVPTTASSYPHCANDTFAGTPRQKDAQGRCIKQDPMQSGSGDQAPEYRFATFSDYSTAVMQRFFEGKTTVDGSGVRSYSGGVIVRDAAFPGGYKRWDTLDRKWVNVGVTTTDKGLYGYDRGLPTQRDVAVHSIVISYSRAGTPDVSMIYPPLSYTGNLRRYVDPTNAQQRADIVPNTGPTPWYCHDGGCDYTVRVTYSDDSVRHVLLQYGFRDWFKPMDPPPASASDPNDGDSFRTWVVNVPGTLAIKRIELLDTPMGWNGVPANATVLLSR